MNRRLTFAAILEFFFICLSYDNPVLAASSRRFNVTESIQVPNWERNDKTAILSCNITVESGEQTEGDPVWYKNDTAVTDLNVTDTRFSVDDESNTLTITDPKRSDAAEYKLRFKIQGDKDYNCSVPFKAGPLVITINDFDKSVNVKQGKDLELQCWVVGYPYPVVTWFKDGVALNNGSKKDPRVKTPFYKGYQNAELNIAKMEYEDAGTYNCTATYPGNVSEISSKTIIVRVKDPMGWLWPFLGIVAEVVALCVIIFIYEKRRNKQAEQANMDNHDGELAEKKGNVRNRRNQK